MRRFLGIAFIQNIYGNSGQAPLMIIGSVPLYNIMAVVVLSFFKPGQNGMDKALLKTIDWYHYESNHHRYCSRSVMVSAETSDACDLT